MAQLALPAVGTKLHVTVQSIDQFDGPRSLKETGGHVHFLKSTCDIGASDMRQIR